MRERPPYTKTLDCVISDNDWAADHIDNLELENEKLKELAKLRAYLSTQWGMTAMTAMTDRITRILNGQKWDSIE